MVLESSSRLSQRLQAPEPLYLADVASTGVVLIGEDRLPAIRIRRVEHAIASRGTTVPAMPQAAFSRLFPISRIGGPLIFGILLASPIRRRRNVEERDRLWLDQEAVILGIGGGQDCFSPAVADSAKAADSFGP
jgi:hypothetical protein